MAETWYPNPGVTQLQHERLMGGGFASGVFGGPADPPPVYAPGSGTREVRIPGGLRAIVEGYGWENDSSEIVLSSLGANASGSTRVDLVVLRLDRSDWSVRVKVVAGTAGAGAPAPTYASGSSGVWELPLAEVVVAPGATTLAGSTVTRRAWYIGSDGQIRCTPTTRPPGEAGRTVWDATLARYLVSDGAGWLVGVEDSGQTTLPLDGGWSSSVNVLHRRNGWVFLALSPQRTGASVAPNAKVVLGTLPVGFRPPYLFESLVSTGGALGRYTIATTGVVDAIFSAGLPSGNFSNFQSVAFPSA